MKFRNLMVLAKTIFIIFLGVENNYANNQLNNSKYHLNKLNDLSQITKNEIVPLVNDNINFNSLTVNASENCLLTCTNDWTNEGNSVIDSDLENYSSSSIIVSDTDFLSVTYPNEDIPAGTYAGFRMKTSSIINLLDYLSIRTKDINGNILETYYPKNSSLTKVLDFSETTNIGFVTSKNFKTIEIYISGLLEVSALDVYYAFIKVYEEKGTSLNCNNAESITNPDFPIEINEVGINGVNIDLLGDVIKNPNFIIDNDTNNFATLNENLVDVGVLASSYLSVKKQKDYNTNVVTPFDSGTFAGFDITTLTLLNINLLEHVTISTYLNGEFQEDSNSVSTVINVPFLDSNKRNIGFVTTKDYDEIKITVTQPIGINLGVIKVHYPIVKKYCASQNLDCNTQTNFVNTEFPVEISNVEEDGFLTAGGTIQNLNNVINSNTDDFAEINLNVNAITNFEFGVVNVLQDYSDTNFVGFVVESSELLNVNLLNNITISTYLDGNKVESEQGVDILLSAPFLSSTEKQTIGLVANEIFDEVRIKFSTVVGVNLGVFKIYHSIIRKACSVELACNTEYGLGNNNLSTYVDHGTTGISGVACAGCYVDNSNALLTSSVSDFAKINITAGVLAKAQITILDPVNTFPQNSYAGFSIKTNSSVVELSLFESITIETLNAEGDVLESASGKDIIDLKLLINILGSTSDGYYSIGFRTNQEYNGLRISVKKLIDVNTTLNLLENNDIYVYKAFVNTTGAVGGVFNNCSNNPFDNDGDEVFDNRDLDDDNDGILDANEDLNCTISQIEWEHNENNGQADYATFSVSNSSTHYQNSSNISFGSGLDESENYAYTYLLKNADSKDFIEAKQNNDYVEVSFQPSQNLVLSSIRKGFFSNSITSPEYNAGNFKIALEYATTSDFSNAVLLFDNFQVGNMKANGYVLIEKAINNIILNSSTTYYFRFYLFDEQNLDTEGRVRFDDVYFLSNLQASCDADLDGIVNSKDTDSDNDDCADALEGDGNIIFTQLVERSGGSVGGSSKNLGIVSNGDGIVLINNNEFTQNTTSAVLSVEIKTACNIDLTLIKTVDKPIVYVGSKIVFSIKLKNTSFFNASEIKVKDLLPEDLSFDVECSEIPENTTYDSQIGIWDLKNTVLKGNEEITLKICAVVTKSNSLIINKTEILSVKENDSDSIANTGN